MQIATLPEQSQKMQLLLYMSVECRLLSVFTNYEFHPLIFALNLNRLKHTTIRADLVITAA